MSGLRLSDRALAEIKRQLAQRDVAIVSRIAQLRLMSGRQLEALYFPPTPTSSRSSSARQCRRALNKLVNARILDRLERRQGGIRAGSDSYLYVVGPAGHRLLEGDGSRPRRYEPSTAFVEHQLAVSEFVVQILLASESGAFELLSLQCEPECWRRLSGVDRAILRPDLFLSVASDEHEWRWFVELDRGTHHLPAIVRKARLYEAYYASGIEQFEHEVFPQVLWLVPDQRRLERLGNFLEGPGMPAGMHVVNLTEEAIPAVIGASS